jgi:RNA polymerase sigma-70 factor (ECF subfamily)
LQKPFAVDRKSGIISISGRSGGISASNEEGALHEDGPETLNLLARVRQGDDQAIEELLARHRPALLRFVGLRLDTRLNPRLDPSDVVQEAQLEVVRHIRDYLRREPMPFWLWLHRTTYQNLVRLRRAHVGAARRSVEREVALPDASSILLARKLFADNPWPGQNLVDEEIRRRVREALTRLDEIDREVLQLRAFEGLENDEVAQVLGLPPGTASKRYGRALLRLRQALAATSPPESGA